ncbi:efflux RND transporter periplasmic adaptor subunit [Zunongwangia sp. F363]|uniref:Efflux RND transporter periplasmic adaptor subunit n=1 Tax=Autumnicola tepida TaxID=3075595 RepID=A0ABU3CBD3_9FLAO|nr:efflux RND transporter periplasmic adaptor subunit [Zunongwangia sp. F363]MDT0643646.1 efflux RND transporter periplasmic adaptor subunit [Zunongwangia sp. F363]
MKKYIIYIGILLAGLLLGYLFFGINSEEAAAESTARQEHESEASEQMWTCSMHPQIMKSEPGDCPICGMYLIPAEADAAGLSPEQFSLTENAMALATIQTAKVGMTGEAASGFVLSGKIEVNEEANAVQTSYFGGRIENLNINTTGEQVKRGQLLATIYSPELVSAQQELLTAARLKENQPALYRAVRNKLKLWKLSDTQIDAIENSGSVKENFPVYATVGGTVTQKMVQEGDYVEQGQPLYEIADLNNVWAVFDVYENQLSGLEEGQKITITTNAFPDRQFESEISFVNPLLNTSTRTVKIRAELENEKGKLKPGMFVKGRLEVEQAANSANITIPKSAVLWTGERSLVYVKTNPKKPVFEMREVQLGRQLGNNYEVLQGLNAEEEIVVNGTFTVDAAAQLQGKPSMMNGEATEAVSEEKPMQMEMRLPEIFQKDFTSVLDSYLDLKNALVNSNMEEAKAEAYKMLRQVNGLRTKNLGNMEVTHLDKIKTMLEGISENTQLENQRDHFVALSENVLAFVSNMDNLNNTLYLQRCPMANNNKGAYWISEIREIRNPYFGEAMLTCGETKKIFGARQTER